MEALERANEIRTLRAALKRDIKAGRRSVIALLGDPPEYIESMKVFDLLLAAPKYGRVKVGKILQVLRIAPSKTVGAPGIGNGGLSDRQRAELVLMLSIR